MSVKFVKQPKYKIVDKTKELSADALKKINQKLNLSTTNFKAKLQKLFDKNLPSSVVELFGQGDVNVTITKDKKTGGYLLNFSNLGTADGSSLDIVKGVPEISRKMSSGTTSSDIRNGSRSGTTPKIQKDAVDNGDKKGKEKPKSVVDKSLEKAEKLLKDKSDFRTTDHVFVEEGSIRAVYGRFRDSDLKDLARGIVMEAVSRGFKLELNSDEWRISYIGVFRRNHTYEAEVHFKLNGSTYSAKSAVINVMYWKDTFKNFILKSLTKEYGVKFSNKLQVKPVSGVNNAGLLGEIEIFSGSLNYVKLKDYLYSDQIVRSKVIDLMVKGMRDSKSFSGFIRMNKNFVNHSDGFYPVCDLGQVNVISGSQINIKVSKVSGGVILEIYSSFQSPYISSFSEVMDDLDINSGLKMIGAAFKFKSFEDMVRNCEIFNVSDLSNISGVSKSYVYNVLSSKSDFWAFKKLFIDPSKLPDVYDYYDRLRVDEDDIDFDVKNQNGTFKIEWIETPGVKKSADVKFSYDKRSGKFKVNKVGKVSAKKYEVPKETINLSNLDKYFECPECDEYYGKSAEYFGDWALAGDVWRCPECDTRFLLKGKLD